MPSQETSRVLLTEIAPNSWNGTRLTSKAGVWFERITVKIATVEDFVKHKVAPEHKAIVPVCACFKVLGKYQNM